VTLIHPSRSCSPNFPPACRGSGSLRRAATFAKLVSSERQRRFRGVNCLCRTRVVKKQLPATTVFANRASADQGLSRVCIQWKPMENRRWPKKIITPPPFLAERARSKSTSTLLRAFAYCSLLSGRLTNRRYRGLATVEIIKLGNDRSLALSQLIPAYLSLSLSGGGEFKI